MTIENVFFFGVGPGDSAGHHLWRSERVPVYLKERLELPEQLRRPDGTLCSPGDQREGLAWIHHLDGWTVISFWDRSADRRSGCNANFMACGAFSFDELIAEARLQWPSLFKRFGFEICLRVENT